ncbi:hypothetical protein [Paraclostridium bifermentans]|uniref:hypothetical protein n=1 Tax=Paraclostridium bifermentans TaxID=1490 RepID=UPI00189C2CFA|nr:hypothetical protein [Paraclostridium bifermentans]
MKIKKLILATGEEFEDLEIVESIVDEEFLQIPIIKVKVNKKEVLINREYILSLELQKLQTI